MKHFLWLKDTNKYINADWVIEKGCRNSLLYRETETITSTNHDETKCCVRSLGYGQ